MDDAIEWAEVRRWRATLGGLLLEVWHDPGEDAHNWTVGPPYALPMARGRRWGCDDAREDAENAARQLTAPRKAHEP